MANHYKIQYLPLAVTDLDEIIEYIKIDNPIVVPKILKKIDMAISQLINYPFLGVVPKDSSLVIQGYRILIIEQYLIFYIVKGKIVEIHRIISGMRNYHFLF